MYNVGHTYKLYYGIVKLNKSISELVLIKIE